MRKKRLSWTVMNEVLVICTVTRDECGHVFRVCEGVFHAMEEEGQDSPPCPVCEPDAPSRNGYLHFVLGSPVDWLCADCWDAIQRKAREKE